MFQVHPFSQLIDKVNLQYNGRVNLMYPYIDAHGLLREEIDNCVVIEIPIRDPKFHVSQSPGLVITDCHHTTWICHGKQT